MKKTVCPKCKCVHPSDAAIALNRFEPILKLYKANYPGAPTRQNKQTATSDWCAYMAKKNK